MRTLTDRQTEVVKFIRRFWRSNGFGPSYRDVAEHLGVTINAAAGHIEAVIKKGVVTREPGKARSLRLI